MANKLVINRAGASVLTFQIETWAAIAPGLNSKTDFRRWLERPESLSDETSNVQLKQISPMLRRRFGTLGKYAMASALQVMKEGDAIPSVFSSRHGNTELTYSLLEEMGRDEPMSPTGFSLAVHNAVGGLYSIARKDTSTVTSLAVTEGLVIHTLLEAIGQLQVAERVLCVIYDVPLPALYRRYCSSGDFPYAIALILSRDDGHSYTIEQCAQELNEPASEYSGSRHLEVESFRFLELLTGLSCEVRTEVNGGVWLIKKLKS